MFVLLEHNYTETNEFFEKIKSLEKQMENYTTGLHIKCFKNLTLESFEIISEEVGEQIIYLKNCAINKDITLNTAGRTMVILDNTSVSGIMTFNLSIKTKPQTIVIKEKKNNVNGKSLNNNYYDNIKQQNKQDNSNNIIIFSIIIIAVVSGIFFLGYKKNNQLKEE